MNISHFRITTGTYSAGLHSQVECVPTLTEGLVRFIDGPYSQRTLVVPDNQDIFIIREFKDDTTQPIPTYPIHPIVHKYVRAFAGASYFKYQGVVSEETVKLAVLPSSIED